MCLIGGSAPSQVLTGAYESPAAFPTTKLCLQLEPPLPGVSWERATSDVPRPGQRMRISFSPQTAVSGTGPGWHDMGVSGSWPFPTALPQGARLLPLLPPPAGGAGSDPQEKHLFRPGAASVPTTAQDVSHSPSPRDSTRSTEGRQRASKEAAVVEAGVSLLLMPRALINLGHFPALI